MKSLNSKGSSYPFQVIVGSHESGLPRDSVTAWAVDWRVRGSRAGGSRGCSASELGTADLSGRPGLTGFLRPKIWG